jgi:glucose/mannose-6-phosphate isomerase
MKIDLDNLDLMSRIDRSNMVGAVDRFPDAFKRRTNDLVGELKERRPAIRSLVLMGMGGSASAGDVVLDWLRGELKVPALVHREPGLPGFVNSRTMFVAISYSGNTSETLAAFRAARKRRAHIIGVGTGGKLRDMCSQFDAPFVEVESALAPRAALSQLIVAATCVLENFGVVASTFREMSETGRELAGLRSRFRVQTPLERNPAKRLATKLLDHFIVLYSLQRMSSVARRFKNQLAENSKEVAKYDALPEACHNEIEAWHGSTSRMLPILIRDEGESTFEHSIVEAFRSTISSVARPGPIDVRLSGRGRLSTLLSPIFFLDYVSVYLAMLKKVDPTPTELIAEYKRR